MCHQLEHDFGCALLTPPCPRDTPDGGPVQVRVGDIVMTRETYVTDVLLHPGGVAARDLDGALRGGVAAAPTGGRS